MAERSQKEVLSEKIESLKSQLTGFGIEDAITFNQIKRYQHKLNDLEGKENRCDAADEDGVCLSCGA